MAAGSDASVNGAPISWSDDMVWPDGLGCAPQSALESGFLVVVGLRFPRLVAKKVHRFHDRIDGAAEKRGGHTSLRNLGAEL